MKTAESPNKLKVMPDLRESWTAQMKDTSHTYDTKAHIRMTRILPSVQVLSTARTKYVTRKSRLKDGSIVLRIGGDIDMEARAKEAGSKASQDRPKAF